MIIFFLVTAMMNIALGYGLALYLGHARLVREGVCPGGLADGVAELQAAVDSHAAHAPAAEVAAHHAAATPTAPTPTMATPAGQLAHGDATAATAAPAAADEDATKLESDVLAGIEEFRNQLAQMKAQPADAAAPAKAPAMATV